MTSSLKHWLEYIALLTQLLDAKEGIDELAINCVKITNTMHKDKVHRKSHITI
jgi:hypothetical protein